MVCVVRKRLLIIKGEPAGGELGLEPFAIRLGCRQVPVIEDEMPEGEVRQQRGIVGTVELDPHTRLARR
jgi:hypothetical protein